MENNLNPEFENEENFEGGFKVNFEDISSNSTPAEDQVDFNEFTNQPKHYEKKKRGIAAWWSNRKKWQKAVMITAVSLILVVSIVLGVVLTVFDYNYNAIKDDPENLGFENIIDKNIVNVALFGIDARTPDTFDGLSDSIMILSLDTVTKKVKIVSVMRDSFVPITYNNGKVKYGKINSAYGNGGPELAIKTLNTVFGLDISEYATVNFYGMADIIDAVGGIDAELTKAEVGKNTTHGLNECIDEICKHLGLDANDYHIYEAGKHHLNGVQAVAYSRIRYVKNIWGTNNDYGRTDRQRYVMEQLFNKALTMKKSQYVKLAKSLIPCCETSLSYSEIMGLAFDMLLASPTFYQYRMPQENFLMNSPSGVGSVVYYDLDFAKKLIHSFFYEDITPDEYIEQNGVEKNDWYRKGSSSSNKNNASKKDTNAEEENSQITKPPTETNNGSSSSTEIQPVTPAPETGTGDETVADNGGGASEVTPEDTTQDVPEVNPEDTTEETPEVNPEDSTEVETEQPASSENSSTPEEVPDGGASKPDTTTSTDTASNVSDITSSVTG